MADGIILSAVPEFPPESREVSEGKQQLDQAAFEPEATMEKTGEFKGAEDLQKELVAAVDSVQITPDLKATEVSTAPEITLEGLGDTGKITIERPTGDHLIEGDEEPVQGMTGDNQIMVEEPVQSRVGDSHLMEEEEEPVQSRTASSQMTEGDEEPVQGMTDSHLVEEEEPVQELTNPEIVSQIMDQLPEGAETFSSQAAADIVQLVTADKSADYISQTEKYVHGQYNNISKDQVDGLIALTLLKAAQALNSDRAGGLVQPPDSGMGAGISPNLPGTNPGASASAGDSSGGNLQITEINTASGSENTKKLESMQQIAKNHIEQVDDPVGDVKKILKLALQLIKEAIERQQQNADKITT